GTSLFAVARRPGSMAVGESGKVWLRPGPCERRLASPSRDRAPGFRSVCSGLRTAEGRTPFGAGADPAIPAAEPLATRRGTSHDGPRAGGASDPARRPASPDEVAG